MKRKESLLNKVNQLHSVTQDNQYKVNSTKKKIKNKEKVVYEEVKPVELPEGIDYDEQLEIDNIENERKELIKDKKNRIIKRIVIVLLIIGSLYCIFLIYGVINTDYVYDRNGKVVPQSMSISDIKKKDEFNKVYGQYQVARSIYEDVLKLDYRLSQNMEDQKVIATEYQKELDKLNEFIPQLKALEVSSEYTQIISMLTSWSGDNINSINSYCTHMSQAISQNDNTTANTALSERNTIYSDFQLITQNLTSIAEKIKGVDITSLYKWSPENYVQKNLSNERKDD